METKRIESLIEDVDSQIVRIRTKSLDVSFNELYDMYENEELIIAPDYQRLFRWEPEKQSRFIESLILEMPVPPIFVIETDEGIYRKCSVFRTHLPDDTSLHRFYRRVDFIEQMDEFQNKILHLEDTLIDTESNLRYVVLQKNLYKLGLSITVFEEHSSDIDALVNRRNSIAHGNSRAGVTEAEFSKWENKVYRMLSDITRLLYDYANHQRYLKTPPTEQ